MLYFLGKRYRVVAHDRRGHGRSSQMTTATTGRARKASQGVIQSWWRPSTTGGARAAARLRVKALSESDFTQDLKTIGVPTLVMQG